MRTDLSFTRWGLPLLLALCIVRLWMMPLGSSLWVDEMATTFVIEHGAKDPTLAVAPQVPASIYYALPKASESVLGFSEFALRLPSLLAMLAALWLIGKIAARLIHPNAAWFAVFACLLLRGFNYQASDARPYALGTAVLCAGVWFLIRWLDSNGWVDGAAFAVCAALLWRVHLVFWPFYLIFALYAAVRIARRDTAVTWTRAGGVFVIIGASLIPVLQQAVAIDRGASAHVVSAPPGTKALMDSLKLGLLVVSAAGAAVFARALREHAGKMAPATNLTLVAAWWLSAPIGLFAFSWITGNTTFVQRYLYAGLPGMALAATAAAAMFLPATQWKHLALVFGAGALVIMGDWTSFWPQHQHSDWRDAALAINAQGMASNTPVICPSPFIEALPPVWRPDYPLNSFLYSQLLVYRVDGQKYPFPFESSREAEVEARRLSEGPLESSGRFALYGPAASVTRWRDWFEAQPEFADWSNRRLGSFGDVEAVMFTANPRQSAR